MVQREHLLPCLLPLSLTWQISLELGSFRMARGKYGSVNMCADNDLQTGMRLLYKYFGKKIRCPKICQSGGNIYVSTCVCEYTCVYVCVHNFNMTFICCHMKDST